MSDRSRPYIGVTGIVTPADVETIASCASLVPPTHRLMAGVLVSAKTLHREHTASRRYPSLATAKILLGALDARGAWPVVHFNCREGLPFYLGALAALLPSMRGLQINVGELPPRDMLAHFRRLRPDVEVILQYRPATYGRDLGNIVRIAEHYADVAGHILIDGSMGGGVALGASDAHWYASLTTYLRMMATRVGVGLAGALGPDAAPTLRGFRECAEMRVSRLSFDAESGVRSPVADPIPGEKGQDALDKDRAMAWVRIAAEAVS